MAAAPSSSPWEIRKEDLKQQKNYSVFTIEGMERNRPK